MFRYTLAVLAMLLGVLFSFVLRPHSYLTPFIFFFPPVLIAVWLGGFRLGLLASVVASLWVDYFLLPPYGRFSFGPASVIQTLFFAITCVSVCWLADRALRKTSERYISLFENMAEGCAYCRMLFDAHGRPIDFIYLDVNGAFSKLTGLQDVIGRRVTEVIPGIAAVNPELLEVYGRVATTGQPEKFEIEVKPIDKWMAVSAYSTRKDHFVAVFDNITDRKRTEEALRSAGQRLAAVVGTAMDGIITVDEDQRIMMFNNAAEAIFRCPASQAIGKPLDVLIPERFREAHREHIRRFGNTGMTTRSVYRPASLTGLRADGEEFPMEATISQADIGNEKLFTVILRDISKRKETEEALIRSEKLATVGRLAASIAHEINNPLEAIMGLIYLSEGHPSLDPTVREYLKTAQAEVTRAGHIVRQTLGFSRGGTAINRFRPTQVLDGLLTLFEHKLRRKQIHCEKEYLNDLQISGVESEIRQVFSNLLSNAIDAVPLCGSIKLRISSTLPHIGPPGIRLTVADNGPGIATGHLTRLFEPFFTTKETGNGLGLWVTSEIVKKHGGLIRVRSRAGDGRQTGTIFSLFLPAESPRKTEISTAAANENQAVRKKAV